jgi:hypothetical protein
VVVLDRVPTRPLDAPPEEVVVLDRVPTRPLDAQVEEVGAQAVLGVPESVLPKASTHPENAPPSTTASDVGTASKKLSRCVPLEQPSILPSKDVITPAMFQDAGVASSHHSLSGPWATIKNIVMNDSMQFLKTSTSLILYYSDKN